MKPLFILSALLLTAVIAVTSATRAQAFLGLFGKYQQVQTENGAVTIPLAQIATARPIFFAWTPLVTRSASS